MKDIQSFCDPILLLSFLGFYLWQMEWLDLAEEDLLGVAGLDEGSGLVGSAGAGKIFKLYTQVIFYAEETSIQLARSVLLL